MKNGCCNATLTAALAAITARIATEAGRADPEFVRGLKVAKLLTKQALTNRQG
jgi:hypothetical protein